MAATVGAGTLAGYTGGLWISFFISLAALATAFFVPRVLAQED